MGISRINPQVLENEVHFRIHESKPDFVPDVDRTDIVKFAVISQLSPFPTREPYHYVYTVAFWLPQVQVWVAYLFTSYQERSGGTSVMEEDFEGPYRFLRPPPTDAEVRNATHEGGVVELHIGKFKAPEPSEMDLFRGPAALTDFASIVLDCTSEVKAYFARHPERLYDLEPRRFEILVADILRDFGFETELTSITRDGGRDIYAYLKSTIASFLLFVECKRWAPRQRVGIDVVQRVYGAAKAGGAHQSMIVTTSFFTEPARREQRKVSTEVQLADFDTLKAWLGRYRNG